MPLTVLIAPSGFKESLSADEVAEQIARGVLRAMPGARILMAPIFGAERKRTTDEHLFIVETKSANGNGNGNADKILRALHQHPANGGSKYCVGMSMTSTGSRHDRFLPALRKLGAAPLQPMRIAA